MPEIVLETQAITKRFAGVVALSNVSFSLFAVELVTQDNVGKYGDYGRK